MTLCFGTDFCQGFVHYMSLSLAQIKVTKQLFDLFHCATVFYSMKTKVRTLFQSSRPGQAG